MWKLGDLKDSSLDDLTDAVASINDVEDCLGTCGMLVRNLNRVPSPEETSASHRSKKIKRRKEILAVRPDRNNSAEKVSQEISEN